tara:strand:+ start:828 stop:983 length:156 start_codon:yes stop_codon:yes gene_type:complete
MIDLTDICCRMITTDGIPVTLEERIWMTKFISKHKEAKSFAESILQKQFHP